MRRPSRYSPLPRLVALVLACAVFIAPAQALMGEPLVRTTGEATVEVQPDYVEFWLHLTQAGSSFEEAGLATRGLEQTIVDATEALELTPLDVKVSAQAIPDVNTLTIHRSIRIRYPARIIGSDEDSRQYFAWLCDTNRILAAQLTATLEGPILGVNDRDRVMQSALTLAMERAYPLAERAARDMQSAVVSVHEAEVTEVIWNDDPNWRGLQPEYGRVTCTVRVRMAYTIGGL